MTPAELTDWLHHNIRLSTAMEVRVSACDAQHLELVAPLAPNANHHGSGFGGSLATLGILGGWSLVYHALRLEGLEPQLVIQNSQCEYLAPATGELSASSVMPADEWPRFLTLLRRRGRGRIEVATTISGGGIVAAQHRGSFVAIAGRESSHV